MNRRVVTTVLNISTLVAVGVTWGSLVGSPISWLEFASLLGVVAFSLMWVHYAVDAIAPLDEGEDHQKDTQYIASRIVVLVALLTHPFLVNYYLVSEGFGFPPASYEQLLGDLALVVLLGWAALAAFILFELRQKIRKYDRVIFHANIVAMFLVLIHAFLIGMFMMNSWYVWVWWFYLVTFTLIIVRRYMSYYASSPRKWIAISIVTILALIAAWSGFAMRVDDKSVQQSTTQMAVQTPITQMKQSETVNELPVITTEQLATSNGLDGAKCWIAIDGAVYDTASSNQWRNGEHVPSNGQATCGRDLTEVISRAPHGKEVLGQIQQVGTLE